MAEQVRVEDSGAVRTVILSRPAARNAVDGPTAAALAEAFADFDADDSAAVAVLWGEGGTFCAGADLKAVGTGRGNRLDATGDGPMGPTRMRLGKPVIAAIAGHAVAGGLELALWCDLRVAAEDASFLMAFARVGLGPDSGASWTLSRLVGHGRAAAMLMLAEPVPAEAALEMGLVSAVVSTDAVVATATEIAAKLAAGPTVAYAAIKETLAFAASHSLTDSLAKEAEAQARCGNTEDHRNAVNATVRARRELGDVRNQGWWQVVDDEPAEILEALGRSAASRLGATVDAGGSGTARRTRLAAQRRGTAHIPPPHHR